VDYGIRFVVISEKDEVLRISHAVMSKLFDRKLALPQYARKRIRWCEVIVSPEGGRAEGVSFPSSDGMPFPRRIEVLGMLSAVHEYLPVRRLILNELHKQGRCLDELIKSRGTRKRFAGQAIFGGAFLKVVRDSLFL
jgi:hypothetical protein